MKKIFIIFLIIISIYSLSIQSAKTVIIPEQSIRFRIIANSNSNKDQSIKIKIKENISQELSNIEANTTNIDSSREYINDNIQQIEQVVDKTLIANNYNTDYNINYGMNYFPRKEYKGVVYPEGNYESLVITLGKGEGNNWWCVLFPPLCLLEGKDNNQKDTEYKFYIKEIIDKFSK